MYKRKKSVKIKRVMDWKKVCLTAQLFAAARRSPMSMHEPTLLLYKPDGHRLFMPNKLSILPNFNATGSWFVRNNSVDGGPPVYFPSVDTTEALMETLEVAWMAERKCRGPHDWKPIYLKSLGEAATLLPHTSSNSHNDISIAHQAKAKQPKHLEN